MLFRSARGKLDQVSIWSHVLNRAENGGSRWLAKVQLELGKRNLLNVVMENPATLLEGRKVMAIRFSQYCYHEHLLELRPNSSISFCHRRPFGIYPFVFEINSHQVRSIFIFILSCWRWSLKNAFRYPEYCEYCDCENDSMHLLFKCNLFSNERRIFVCDSGFDLCLMNLANDNIGKPLAKFCQFLCDYIEKACESIV